ncbi:hypothetical protein FLL45_19055 [Aliikangiella marina]|uniref:Uncharacterized protein n=1 Tax=Aliikangiella marina TaxID=1712262 RepID=A0A545T4Y8_9GAMM|nr:hypothetical protein [Aliikangiella marina]TQV72317.1 hypothetical protein FLL45_19055 [Aliikangiella marina]
MKVGFVIVIAAVFGFTALVYFDSATQQNVYDFCQLNSSGNTVVELKTRADEQGFTFVEVDPRTIELTADGSFSLLNEHVCEVKVNDGRVVSQALVARSKIF